jgi:hypothetical protein
MDFVFWNPPVSSTSSNVAHTFGPKKVTEFFVWVNVFHEREVFVFREHEEVFNHVILNFFVFPEHEDLSFMKKS